MMIFKKSVPRRRFLKGIGATIALPFLDAMIPAVTRAQTIQTPLRFGVFFTPNGMWPMDKWTPKTEGAFELSPNLEPLAPWKDKLVVLSGLDHKEGTAYDGEGPQDHARASGAYLTGGHLGKDADKNIRTAVSMDQIMARTLSADTQLKSLEVGLFADISSKGTCDAGGWSCVYNNTLSWSTPTTALPCESNPRALFERLFGDTDNTDRGVRLARVREQKSILDWVASDVASFTKEIGPSDRLKLTEYLDAVRDVERRIQVAEAESNRAVPKFDRPDGVPVEFDDYAKLMMDLQVLVHQADLTRVNTFMYCYEGGVSRPYPSLGISEVHHSCTHHMNNADMIEKCFAINLYHMELFAYFVDKLAKTQDGDGSLLDHFTILYGSALSNGNGHDHFDLPTILVGGAGGRIKGNRHIRYAKGTQLMNLHATLLNRLGAPVEKFGDSTGMLSL